MILQQQSPQTSHIAVHFLHHFLGLAVCKHEVVLQDDGLFGEDKAFLLVLVAIYGSN